MPQKKQNPRMGLVLSGGGAKGAYQAGVFQAMAELGLCDWVEAVSGCSIGALNALLFTMGDPELWRRVWEESDFSDITGVGTSPKKLEELEDKARNAGSMEEYLRGEWLLPLDGMENMIRQSVDPAVLSKGRPRVSVCAYQLEAEEPQYFWLEERPFPDAVKLAAASSAMPVIFPTVEFEGKHYCDGGMTPPYSGRHNGDKVPLAPLAELGLDVILVVYLAGHDRVDHSLLPSGTRLVELYPSQPLESSPGTGTMDFSREAILRRRELGLKDGRKILAGFFPRSL